MTNFNDKPAFVRRFDGLRSAVRRAEIWHGVSWVVAVAAGGLLLLAASDYLLELSWPTRVAGLAGLAGVAAIVALKWILSPWLWWSRPRTAVEIEQRFPQLGQRVRTIVQFSGHTQREVAAEGVAANLVTALEAETATKAQPLDLGALVPRRKLTAAATLAALSILLLAGAACWDWQLRLAICRALLGDRPYTQMTVAPGNQLVDVLPGERGRDAQVSVELTGRTEKRVIVYSRPADSAEAAWSRLELAPEDAQRSGQNAVAYQATLEDIRRPTEYRVAAGKLRSETYRIDVRYPIAVKEFKATLTPPAYTGVETSTVEGGDLDVIEGTRVRFEVELDRPCTEAALVVCEPPYLGEEGQPQPTPQRIALSPGKEAAGGFSKSRLVTELEFREDKCYWLVARAADGTQLAENRYQVRVRKDQPPQVRFEDPDEALEVHPIAEVLMRIRADDDFGLSKAGIVFQVDNGQEQTLLLEDFPGSDPTAESVSELTARAVLEEVLLLENHDLSPTQAITYYAFAEDNFPGRPKRMETDLRFIDVREFKRLYKVGGT